MKLDEVLLDEALAQPESPPILRVYGFRGPAVTYGCFQKLPAHWLEDPFYESAKRVTGGGLVFHGKDVTYSVVAPFSARHDFRTPQSSYRAFHEVIQNSFRKLGISVDFAFPDPRPRSARRFCFLSPVKNDLLFGPYKVAGAAQKRSGGFFLHQGSVNLRAFLNSDSGYLPFFEAFKKAFLASFREYFQVDFVIQFTTGYERNRPLDFQTADDRRGEPHLQAGSL